MGKEYTTMTITKKAKERLDEWAEANASRKESYSDIIEKLVDEVGELE